MTTPELPRPAPGGLSGAGRDEDRWVVTHSHVRGVLVAVVGTVAALVLQRPDLLVLVTPVALVVVWSSVERPRRRTRAWSRLGRTVATEGDRHAVRVGVTTVPGAELVSTSLAPRPWIRRRPEHGARVGLVDAEDVERGEIRLVTGADPLRWGFHAVGPVLVGAVSPWGAFRWGPVPLAEARIRVLPDPAAFDATAPAPHPRGLVGRHRSTRPGEGSEFASIRPFQWGDRLKRIHWARSLRSGELHVTSSYADQDTHVAVLVDAHIDLGRSEGTGGAASSLDRSVRAAAAMAEHFLHGGDRVSLQVFSGEMPLRVPPGTGRRHSHRVREVLSRVAPAHQHDGGHRRLRLGLGDGALVVMVSALVSPEALTHAAALVRSGLTVVVIDALGEDFELPSDWEPLDVLAWRVRLLERDREVRRIQQAGVPVVAWKGPGSLDPVLRSLARRGRSRVSL
ncbi:hypothetical protein GCM10023169_26110 [Georgenia halophila]|uniref:DUF58 domain-containing protein n=1 Tax=Georgenia halophila TaxID=620889 RepID=A0ABP8LDE3_9MICO